MMMTSAPRGRRLPPDPDDDVDTRVYVRATTMSWDAEKVLEIMRRIAPPVRHAPIESSPWPSKRAAAFMRGVPRAAGNVFLTPASATDPKPPWATGADPHKLPSAYGQSAIRQRAAGRSSIMPWVVFAMCFGITFGICNDRRLRAQLASDLRATPARVMMAVHSLSR